MVAREAWEDGTSNRPMPLRLNDQRRGCVPGPRGTGPGMVGWDVSAQGRSPTSARRMSHGGAGRPGLRIGWSCGLGPDCYGAGLLAGPGLQAHRLQKDG